MIRNNKGFIYPLSLCVYILFIYFLFILYGIYVNKKGIEVSVKNSNMQEYYFLSSLKEIEHELSTEEHPELSGTKTFLHGNVFYTIEKNSRTTFKIDYQLNMKAGIKPIYAISYFDMEQNKMTKWIE
ncbi:DNA transport platform protein [Niallia nealsonii AAU1]|nr:DNA transport platform protein [Niallia nealsonii AAU1]